ncbi:MAG: sigma-70 family RNA polymerase sigma factor [Planctomycetota bacterium]
MMTTDTAVEVYARGRDPEAFRALVDQYEGLVFRTCRRMLSPADSEDAVQDVFVKLMQNASTIRGDLPGWLHRCAVNTCLDQIRRDKARRTRETKNTHADETNQSQSNESLAATLLKDVDEALLLLDDDERMMIVRYYLENESQQSIAKQLSISQPSVARRIEKSLAKLRKLLDRRGVTASAAFLASTLAAGASASEVPQSLTKSLAKLALASPQQTVPVAQLARRIMSGYVLKVVLGVAAVLLGLFVWSRLDEAQANRQLQVIPLTQEPTTIIRGVEYEVLPAETFFQYEYTLDESIPLEDLANDLRRRAEDAGVTIVGRPVFRHPEGLGDEEITLIIAIAVAPQTPLSKNVIRVDALPALTMQAPIGSNAYGIISKVDATFRERGLERSYRDRFIPLDPSIDGGIAFKVCLGVEPKLKPNVKDFVK